MKRIRERSCEGCRHVRWPVTIHVEIVGSLAFSRTIYNTHVSLTFGTERWTFESMDV